MIADSTLQSTGSTSPMTIPQGWYARLQLGFTAREHCTVLSHRQHVGPLLVQRPFYPEGAPCHVYLIHPPGGVVAGDHIELNASLASGTHAVITTPAATKFYRAAHGRLAVIEQHLQLNEATLEWLPQESIFFNGTAVRMHTRIDLDKSSRFIGWEMACYGRRASRETFDEGYLHQALEVWLAGKPLLLDHLRIQGGHEMQQAKWGLNGRSALGSLVAYPATAADVAAVRDLALDVQAFSCTLVDGALLCRCLCTDGAELKAMLQQVWACLRPRLLDRPAVPPRIWVT